MFKYWSIKKYGSKLLPTLEKYYGVKNFYTPSEIRTTVYQQDFNPDYLPLAYLLFLNTADVKSVFAKEFPLICPENYKRETLAYLHKKQYLGFLHILNQH